VAKHLLGSMTERGNPQLLAQFPELALRWAGKRVRRGGGRSTLLSEMTRGGRETLRVAHLRRLFLPRLLRWEDRNSMAFGVEGRYPFLDHRLVEVCLACDDRVLYSKGWVKWPLRLVLDGKIPGAVAWRKDKKGFEVPTEWLSGPLRPDLLASLREPGNVLERQAGEECRSLARRLGGEQNPSASLLERCFRFHVFERWTRRFEVAA
jgi:asparagine synthetase B (glutamine-hydrolysing)